MPAERLSAGRRSIIRAGFKQQRLITLLLLWVSWLPVALAANNERLLMQPRSGLDAAQQLEFHVGASFAHKPWVTAPSTTTARDGLGPRYNAAACADCHIRNGKGPVNPQGESLNSVLRLGGSAAGFQLQPRAIPGVAAEGKLALHYATQAVRFTDGTTVTLKKPIPVLHPAEPRYASTQLSLRMPPLLAGMAVLEAVPDDFIRQQYRLQQQRSDAIRGQISQVNGAIGRFGWKAEVVTLEQQIALALHQDMGLTSAYYPQQNCNAEDVVCGQQVSGGEPEVSALIFQRLVQYVRWLAIPATRTQTAEAQAGRQLFEQLQCSVCHVPEVATELARRNPVGLTLLRPYTDLLLHDMGDGLADTLDLPHASRRQWRTAPLQGIGIVDQLMPVKAYLHDGRAASLMEAVLWHGGEAQASQQAVLLLDAAQRRQLIAFLQSL